MGERKSRVKSRLGCTQCKARRVKCKRRQEQCSYKTAESLAPSTPEAGVPDHANGVNTISHDLHIKEMELMHHYLTDTYATLAIRPQGPPVQLFEIPKLAFKHDYMLDTLLAIALLHIASTRTEDSRELVADAVRYQTRALSSYRQALTNLTAEECQALYHCSAKLGVIALGLRVVDPETAATRATGTLTHLSQLWKGTWLILRASRDLVDAETYDMLFQAPEWVVPIRRPPPQAEALLEMLRRRAKDHEQSPADDSKKDDRSTESWDLMGSRSPPVYSEDDPSAIYLATIDFLEVLFRVCQPEPSRVLAFIVQVPQSFMDMLAEKDPLASAICLLYAATFQELEGKWWVQDFRRQLVEELYPVVLATDPELAEVANWVGT